MRTYISWSFWVGVAFFSVYPAMNWITSLRARPWHLYVPAELTIPFVPQFVWAYLSMYVLFALPAFVLPPERMPSLGKQLMAGCAVSAALFLLFPAELGFARQLPAQKPYDAIFAGIFGVDRPYNLVPSLHVIFSVSIALACADVIRPAARVALLAWLAVIVASTVLVHQHHLLDVVSALAVVVVLRRSFRDG
ncbi:MAG TPA: Ser/Thr and Tyr protein phosphatase [Thermoanaerobaculia bacterium]|nr:Ser/Thr and Tyr protein phosphatase [Thermoanaerobaculia bacterium]